MSFILDALKKSEAERQRQAAPMTFEAPTARPQRGVPIWVVTAGALLVLVNLVGLVWLMLRKAPAPGTPANTAAPAAAVAPGATAAAPASAAPTDGTGAPTDSAGLSAAACAAAPLLLPAEAEPAQPEAPEDTRIAALKRYATLGSSAPALRLDLHVYSTNPADRYALINMRKLREGDTSEDGIKVKELTRSGVVLLDRGEELLLSRDCRLERGQRNDRLGTPGRRNCISDRR
jgi:general secretion pathway protein B